MKNLFKHSGQSLVEILITMGLAAILLPALYVGLYTSRSGRVQNETQIQAETQIQTMVEAMRSLRESNWASIATNGTFYPVASGATWSLATGSTTTNGLTRSLTISDALRDTSGNIVATGGTPDPSTKQIIANVAWSTPYPSSSSETFYLTRYLKNTSYTDTKLSDFSAGIVSGTSVIPSTGSALPQDAQVELANISKGGADWCNPNLSITPFDLPGNGITTAITATVSGNFDYAYTTTGGNASGDSMDVTKITHTSPPISSLVGSYNNFKTYSIGIDPANQYALLPSDHPGLTVDIVRVTSTPYTSIGTFAGSQGGNGSGSFVAYSTSLAKNIGYVTASNFLYTFDLASPDGTRAELARVSLPGKGDRVVVVGNYAYVATANTSEQLVIYNVSNPASPQLVSQSNIQNGQPATDIFVSADGTRVYLVTSQKNPTVNDFFIINTSSKVATLPQPIGSYNTGAMSPTGVVAVSGSRAIIVGTGGEQYKVLSIINESNPIRCGGLTNPNGASAITSISSVYHDDGSQYSYILTNSANAELQLIAGGPGEAPDWCSPQTAVVNTLPLTATGSAVYAMPGHAYVGAGNGSPGDTFYSIGITQPDPPGLPATSLSGRYSDTFKVNNVYSDGQYGYVAITPSGQSYQVGIIDMTSTPYQMIGTIGVPGATATTSANGVFVTNNVAYITSGNTLYTYNVANKVGPHTTPLTSIVTWGGVGNPGPTAKQVVVANNYAFVTATNTLYGLQKFSTTSDGTQLRLVGVSSLNWSATTQGLAISSSGDRAYVAFTQGEGSTSNGFYIVDTSPPDPPPWWLYPTAYSVIGVYPSGSMLPTAIALADTNRAIIVGTEGNAQYQVVNTANEASPTNCGGFAISQGITSLATVLQPNGNEYAYITTGPGSNQFEVIQGGSGAVYSASGVSTFESKTFDATNSAVFNSLLATVYQPPSTQITMQVGVANAVSGSCNNVASFTYLGPNGDPASYFSASNSAVIAAISLGSFSTNYVNPARCYRYKAFLSSSNPNQTPIVYDVSTNYSP